MDALEAAQKFIDGIALALSSTGNLHPTKDAYVRAVAATLNSTRLEVNSVLPQDAVPSTEWKAALELSRQQRHDSLPSLIDGFQSGLNWISARRFWPEEEYGDFSKKMSGAFLVGPGDAAFSANDRYIALLGAIDTHVTYPLHEHRIEELYYVVSGHAGWSHDAKKWTLLDPGEVFVNRSHEPHAIRTYGEPLLFCSIYLPPFGWEGGMVDSVD